MRFVVTLYEKQIKAGREFVHENPARAKSWALPEIRKMMRKSGVGVYEADQCMYGLKTWDKLALNWCSLRSPAGSWPTLGI